MKKEQIVLIIQAVCLILCAAVALSPRRQKKYSPLELQRLTDEEIKGLTLEQSGIDIAILRQLFPPAPIRMEQPPAPIRMEQPPIQAEQKNYIKEPILPDTVMALKKKCAHDKCETMINKYPLQNRYCKEHRENTEEKK